IRRFAAGAGTVAAKLPSAPIAARPTRLPSSRMSAVSPARRRSAVPVTDTVRRPAGSTSISTRSSLVQARYRSLEAPSVKATSPRTVWATEPDPVGGDAVGGAVGLVAGGDGAGGGGEAAGTSGLESALALPASFVAVTRHVMLVPTSSPVTA